MAEAAKAESNKQQQFVIKGIYVKDVSFETPNSPEIFEKTWKPEINLEIATKSHALENDSHEVILSLTATVKSNDKMAFLIEVKQAGIFSVDGFPNDQLGPLLGSFCPNILFPYARETISNIVNRGGFPPLNLAPINFDALYTQQVQQASQAGDTGESS